MTQQTTTTNCFAPATDLPDLGPASTLNVANVLAGSSPRIRQVVRAVTRLAHSPEITALIRGESGVGKDIVARSIHRTDSRETLQCVTLDATRFADTGAIPSAWLSGIEDAFHEAGGTLLIEHAEKLSPAAQAAVLAVINRLRTSATDPDSRKRVVRVLGLSNADIEQAFNEGRFHDDLFTGLRAVTVTIPPLRERKDDIPMLANRFLHEINEQFGKHIEGFEEKAIRRMLAYPWPGNVRELRSTVERAVILTHGSTIEPQHVMVSGASELLEAQDEEMTLAEMERRLILSVLQKTDGNRSRTAKVLGINRGTLYNKLRQYRVIDTHNDKEDCDEQD